MCYIKLVPSRMVLGGEIREADPEWGAVLSFASRKERGMKVGPGKLVVFAYELYDEDGELLDASDEEAPFSFIFGEGSIIPGLEKGLEGMEPGEGREITVLPEEGYGPWNPKLVQRVPRERFAGGPDLEMGMSYTGRTESGNVVFFKVTDMDEETVEIDMNHPLAGKTLRFQVTVVDVMEPSGLDF